MQKHLCFFRHSNLPKLGAWWATKFVCTSISKQWWKFMFTSEGKKIDNITFFHLELSKNLTQYIVPRYSPTYVGIPFMFSLIHSFSPQCLSPYDNFGFNQQVGNSQSFFSTHQSFLQKLVSNIEHGVILSTNPHGPILPRNRGLYHEKVGDIYHVHDGVANNLSLGDDESNDSVEFSKNDLHHPTHGRGNIGK